MIVYNIGKNVTVCPSDLYSTEDAQRDMSIATTKQDFLNIGFTIVLKKMAHTCNFLERNVLFAPIEPISTKISINTYKVQRICLKNIQIKKGWGSGKGSIQQ